MVRALFAVCLLALTGCGYSSQSLLPSTVKSVHVAPVVNAINLSAEISDQDQFRVYRPGLEVDLTNAIINRFIFDGNLKVASKPKADSVVEARLVRYSREALRYTEADDVQEYRLSVELDVVVRTQADDIVLWKQNVIGDTTFFLSGARAASEDEAVAKAVEDVARRVVEKTIEIW